MLVPRLLEHGAGGGASGAELTTSTVNTVLQFLARLLRSNLLAATKLPETLLLQLVPLLEDVQVGNKKEKERAKTWTFAFPKFQNWPYRTPIIDFPFSLDYV